MSRSRLTGRANGRRWRRPAELRKLAALAELGYVSNVKSTYAAGVWFFGFEIETENIEFACRATGLPAPRSSEDPPAEPTGPPEPRVLRVRDD